MLDRTFLSYLSFWSVGCLKKVEYAYLHDINSELQSVFNNKISLLDDIFDEDLIADVFKLPELDLMSDELICIGFDLLLCEGLQGKFGCFLAVDFFVVALELYVDFCLVD